MDWRFWAELLLQSGIVLLACAGLLRFAWRMNAAERYRIGLLAFGLLAALPLLSALVPAIPIGNLFATRAMVTVETGPLLATNAAVSQHSWHINWFPLAWAIGAALGLGRLLMGSIAVSRLVRRSIPLRDEETLGLLRELTGLTGIKRVPEISLIDKSIVPMTFGILRPRILLPADCVSWSASRWRVVLLHELAHIERHDVAVQWFAAAICALWWFQPLAWRARKTVREESERACDEQVLAAGLRASEYATELLAIARAARGRAPACAVGMASGRLEARLHAILRRETMPRSRLRGFTAILTLLVFGTAASAIDLGGSPMKRTILSGLLFSAGLSAATISGTVLEPSGAAIPDANVALINPDNSAQQQTISDPDGKFSFDGLAAGQYIVRVEKPGFPEVFQECTVKADTNVTGILVMTSTTAPQVIRIGGNVMASKVAKRVPPVYPPEAKAAHIQGRVTINATISKDGTPTELTVVSSPSPALSQSALDSVRQWRYRPVLLNGNPVVVRTTIYVNYQLTQ